MNNWDELCNFLSDKFGNEVDLSVVLFLVGVRERGLCFQEFSKEEKLNLINFGGCVLFKEMGLVEEKGVDSEGWPVFKQKSVVFSITEERKNKILQECAINYFNRVLG